MNHLEVTGEAADEITVRGLEQPIDVVRICLPVAGPDTEPDPVCRIPLTHATALSRRRGGDGRELLFCAESCAEVWDQRRRGSSEIEAGSIREVWMR